MINSFKSLIEAVSSSTKYRQVSPDLIRTVGQRELAIRPSWKAAVKATKNKLHQVGGAYQVTKPDYADALALLRDNVNSPADFRESCRQIMELACLHARTASHSRPLLHGNIAAHRSPSHCDGYCLRFESIGQTLDAFR